MKETASSNVSTVKCPGSGRCLAGGVAPSCCSCECRLAEAAKTQEVRVFEHLNKMNLSEVEGNYRIYFVDTETSTFSQRTVQFRS